MKRLHHREEDLNGPLPDEVVSQIFSFVKGNLSRLRLTLVSKKFFTLVTPLIKEVTFHSDRWSLKKIEKRVPNLTGLALLYCGAYRTDNSLISQLTRLKSLSLHSCSGSGQSMSSLTNLTNLKHLCLRHIPVKSDTISRLTNLETLGLLGTNMKDKGLSCLTNLTLLNLSKEDQFGITDQSLVELTKLETLMTGNNFSKSALKKLTNLRKLVLYENSKVNWKTIWSFPKLEEFLLCACDNMDDILTQEKKEWEITEDWAIRGKKKVL